MKRTYVSMVKLGEELNVAYQTLLYWQKKLEIKPTRVLDEFSNRKILSYTEAQAAKLKKAVAQPVDRNVILFKDICKKYKVEMHQVAYALNKLKIKYSNLRRSKDGKPISVFPKDKLEKVQKYFEKRATKK